jgi:hypothetical protein
MLVRVLGAGWWMVDDGGWWMVMVMVMVMVEGAAPQLLILPESVARRYPAYPLRGTDGRTTRRTRTTRTTRRTGWGGGESRGFEPVHYRSRLLFPYSLVYWISSVVLYCTVLYCRSPESSHHGRAQPTRKGSSLPRRATQLPNSAAVEPVDSTVDAVEASWIDRTRSRHCHAGRHSNLHTVLGGRINAITCTIPEELADNLRRRPILLLLIFKFLDSRLWTLDSAPWTQSLPAAEKGLKEHLLSQLVTPSRPASRRLSLATSAASAGVWVGIINRPSGAASSIWARSWCHRRKGKRDDDAGRKG